MQERGDRAAWATIETWQAPALGTHPCSKVCCPLGLEKDMHIQHWPYRVMPIEASQIGLAEL